MPPETSPDALRNRIRIVSFVLLVVGAAAVFYLRTRGVRFIGPVPTLVLLWVPWAIATGVENWIIRAPIPRWLTWVAGVGIFVGLTIYLRR